MAANLSGRWATDSGVRLANDVFAALRAGGSPNAEFGTVDGRVDLRGFRLPEIAVEDGPTIRGQHYSRLMQDRWELTGAQLNSLDFTQSSLAHIDFVDCTVSDSTFDRARFDGVRLFRCRFRDCSFAGTRFTDGVLSSPAPGADSEVAGDGTHFEGCDLSRMRVKGAVCQGLGLTDCRLPEAALSQLSVRYPAIVRTVFGGSLRDVQFDGRTASDLAGGHLRDVDFADATFDDVGFNRVDCDGVRWPRRQRYIWVRGDVRRFFEMMAARPTGDPVAEVFVDTGLSYASSGQREYMVVTDDFENSRDPREHQLELEAERTFMEGARTVAAGDGAIDVGVHLPEQ